MESIKARLLKVSAGLTPDSEVNVKGVPNPISNRTLGEIGVATAVEGPAQFNMAVLIQPFEKSAITGIDLHSVRVFRWDSKSNTFNLLRNSSVNTELSYTWAKIVEPGIYIPIGLPRDRLVQEMLKIIAYQHYFISSPSKKKEILASALRMFTDSKEENLEQWRRVLTVTEIQSSLEAFGDNDIRIGDAGTIRSFPLPKDVDLKEFKAQLNNLDIGLGELPEEHLFYSMPNPRDWEPRWPILSFDRRIPIDVLGRKEPDPIFFPSPYQLQYLCWFQSPDWTTYHHDEGLSGVATGCSRITSATVGRMMLYRDILLDGPIIGVPSIVRGKIYVGTANSISAEGGMGGTLYKIDLGNGNIENEFTFNTPFGQGSRQGYAGIGSSPAVIGGRVYFSGLDGHLYCLDDTRLSPIWITDLRNPDLAHNQPVQNYAGLNHGAEGWSSPLVIDGRVYVGFGEGESEGPNNFGFVYCLDANTGKVLWLFCTNQFDTSSENAPNMIPPSCLHSGIDPPAPFQRVRKDPPNRGASPWSSCSYDRRLNRVYIGTGNALIGGGDLEYTPLPDPRYASGVISLDGRTGQFRGFFQPSPGDSYRTTDVDIDIPAGPMLFTRGQDQVRVMAIGSKNGSFFLLNPDSMEVLARRQLLPYDSSGRPFPEVDAEPSKPDPTHPEANYHENYSGIFDTATVHYGYRRLFVGLGGYRGADSINSPTTPFMRALDWSTLNDAWTTAGENPPKYLASEPPMYTTRGETGYSSPAVVNDVVFMSTTKKGLYAFDVETGVCLWSAGNLGRQGFIRGPGVYRDSIVIGTAETAQSQGTLKIYSL